MVAEPTGTYHLGLLGYAHEQGWQVSLPNPKIVRDWAKGQGQRTKTDTIDACTLASYGAKEQPPCQQPLPKEVLILRHKPKKVALVATARKILGWALGVFRSGNPFDPALASAKAL